MTNTTIEAWPATHDDDDGEYTWYIMEDFGDTPVFDELSCYEIHKRLKHSGVCPKNPTPECFWDHEHSCCYYYLGSKRSAKEFEQRLNSFIQAETARLVNEECLRGVLGRAILEGDITPEEVLDVLIEYEQGRGNTGTLVDALRAARELIISPCG